MHQRPSPPTCCHLRSSGILHEIIYMALLMLGKYTFFYNVEIASYSYKRLQIKSFYLLIIDY